MNAVYAAALAAVVCVYCWTIVLFLGGNLLPQTLAGVYAYLNTGLLRMVAMALPLALGNWGLMMAIQLHPAYAGATITLASIVIPAGIALHLSGAKVSTEVGVIVCVLALVAMLWLPQAIGRAPKVYAL